MGSSTRAIRGHVPPVPGLFSLLLTLMPMTLVVDAPSINQPTMIQCPVYENTYCNNAYQFCHPHNPECVNCSNICSKLNEDPHHCRDSCPIYYHNAIEAAAKLAESTTQVTTFTTEQTDLGSTSPGSSEDISKMGAGEIALFCLLAFCIVVVAILVVFLGCIYMQYRKEIWRHTWRRGFGEYFCQQWTANCRITGSCCEGVTTSDPDDQNEPPVENEQLNPNGQADRNQIQNPNGQADGNQLQDPNGQADGNQLQDPNGQADRNQLQDPNGQADRNQLQDPNGQADRNQLHDPNGQADRNQLPDPNGQADRNQLQDPNGQADRNQLQDPNGQADRNQLQDPNGQADRNQLQDPNGQAERNGPPHQLDNCDNSGPLLVNNIDSQRVVTQQSEPPIDNPYCSQRYTGAGSSGCPLLGSQSS